MHSYRLTARNQKALSAKHCLLAESQENRGGGCIFMHGEDERQKYRRTIMPMSADSAGMSLQPGA
jgi:hypothetical protein